MLVVSARILFEEKLDSRVKRITTIAGITVIATIENEHLELEVSRVLLTLIRITDNKSGAHPVILSITTAMTMTLSL